MCGGKDLKGAPALAAKRISVPKLVDVYAELFAEKAAVDAERTKTREKAR